MTLLLWFMLGFVMTTLFIRVSNHVISQAQEKKKLARAKKKKELEQFDENGSLKVYDAHYARKLEIEQGLVGKLTQCDDSQCTTCRWKVRMYSSFETGDFPPGSDLLTQRQEFIKTLPDDLSDELYDSMYADWLVEMAVEINAAKEVIAAKREVKRRQKLEARYNTPYEDICRYRAEGRKFSASDNSWSEPGNWNVNKATVIVPEDTPEYSPSEAEYRFWLQSYTMKCKEVLYASEKKARALASGDQSAARLLQAEQNILIAQADKLRDEGHKYAKPSYFKFPG